MRRLLAACRASSDRLGLLLSVALAAVWLLGPLPPARAAITATGDITPPDPSTWTSSTLGDVGYSASGSVTVDSGSGLLSGQGILGYLGGSTGVVTVTGAGSTWTNSTDLYVGYTGRGTLNVTGGGVVAAASVLIGNGLSVLAIDVGNGSRLTVNSGSGPISNNGKVRILAGANPIAGTVFTPVSATTWSGTGTFQAVGGSWNASNHAFTASAIEPGTTGTPVAIDLAAKQRMLVSDSGTRTSLGASFVATTNSSLVDFTASPISGSTEAALQSLLSAGESVLSGWTCSATGYALGNPAYLSFALGGGYSRSGLDVWHYDGSSWTAFTANDLTYDGTYASFTVTGFNGYAITGVAILPGDANSDGKVDITDLNKVLTNYNKSGTDWRSGDFDGNGLVDVADLNKVLTNYNKTAAASAGVKAVPEPSTLLLAVAGLVGLAACAWRKRRR